MRDRIHVNVKRESARYPVVVAKSASAAQFQKVFAELGLLEGRGQMGRLARRACILIDDGFARARLDVEKSLARLYPASKNLYLHVPGAETSKSMRMATHILGEMIKAGFTRNDLLIAVGGGVVGDLGGFVASLYHRGMDVVHIPTTLLAMVDSSIGGKTAVNHPEGKNLIGAFHQPVAVIEVLDFLESLPDFEFLSGLGEVFKYGVGFSASLFKYLEKHSLDVLRRDPVALSRILLESVSIKARVIGQDERETGVARLKLGLRDKFADRRLLNLGHTMGHGIEKAYALPHGMAVAIGVTMAAKLSAEVKLCRQQCYDDVMALAHRLSLKTQKDIAWKLKDLLPYVKRDKKVVGNRLQFICLKGIGQATIRPIAFSELKLLEG